jgi:tetratricopeptide (TPR) repeat protein
MPFNHFNVDAIDYIRYDRAKILADARALSEVQFNALVSLVTPGHYEGLIEFRRECLGCLEHIETKKEAKDYLESLVSDMDKMPVFEAFHNHLTSILALHWFKSRREEAKARLLNDGYPLKLKKADVKRALDLVEKIIGERSITPFHMAADLMYYRGMLDEETVIYEALLEEPGLDPFIEAHIHDNLGILYRERGMYKNMISSLKKALPYFEMQEDHYRHALILKNMGEANYMLGRKDRCLKLYGEAEEVIQRGDPEDRIKLLLNLSTSCGRIGERQREREYLGRILDDPDTSMDILRIVDMRLRELDK